MVTQEQAQLGKLFTLLAEELDVSPSRYKESVERYKTVGQFLAMRGSPLVDFEPDVYSQGSFAQGTVIRPLTEEDELDIDLVCEFKNPPNGITQKQLKFLVGDRLRSDETYEDMLVEKQRCWRLDYANQFHMDILPAIEDRGREDGSILIPDKQLDAGLWHYSNPRGYSKWFRSQMEQAFNRSRQSLAKAQNRKIDDVPEWEVKTPLQRAIQILKRHRDIEFENDSDNKPISIIISTLAAKAYSDEDDTLEALTTIVSRMPRFIEERKGILWVSNPVNDYENFADKWAAYPIRAKKFFSWLETVESTIQEALIPGKGLHNVADQLRPHFGKRPVDLALSRFGKEMLAKRNDGQLRIEVTTGFLGATGALPVKEHSFFGE
jgi:hypothetical protein